MQLQFCSWPMIERYLQRSRGIIIPIGSTEQHGPSGLLGTDALCAAAIAQALGKRHQILIAPTLAYGVAQFNLAFPGTISLRASTSMAMFEDIIDSLARQGFQRIYWLNGHGGNLAPLRAAIQDSYWPYSIARQAAAVRHRLRSWWDYPATNALRQRLYGAGEGLHATPSEIALTQHLYPASVQADNLAPAAPLSAAFVRDHGGDNHADAERHRQRFPDGRVGSDSARASAAAGAELMATAVSEAYADYSAFLAEDECH